MAIKQAIWRASDGVLLCNEVAKWSGWQTPYKAPVIETVNGVPYIQPQGVALKTQDLTLLFADHFPGATEARLALLIEAHRRSKRLVFRDSKGDVNYVRVYAPIGPDSQERWEEVRTKDIYRVKVTLMKEKYIR